MPYNNTAIPPPDEITGTSALPLARVKKIIAMDEDLVQCSNSAAFAISVATENFIRYLTEQAHNVVKAERKPRRNIQYKDFANAVARIDNLDFLADVIPKTTTYKQFKEKRAKEEAASAALAPVAPGQTTLQNGFGGAVPIGHLENHPDRSSREESNGVSSSQKLPFPMNRSPVADRTLHTSVHGHPPPLMQRDVEMEDGGI
ncbi:hypothetical protein GJ744_002302 [Endocarpon pusillum]|uniref:Transcription factor CBF/NF-Y/archaeal histone domain-containing protein n=1 Tax=Endocarpon pusillum TaxID=364733 RepID=A0A8H7E8A6_9EURO|nr:hypothetical protein GJ744_002302 [Endocarpon pusillum]